MFEKAFILLVGLVVVFLPALLLTATSFDWEYESIDDDGIAPNGYWIQLYLIIYVIELFDCIAICDATFMLSYMGLALYFIYILHNKQHDLNQKFVELHSSVMDDKLCRLCKYFVQITTTLICCSLTIVFLFILFQFAESGFFSPNGDINAGSLFIWSFLVKIFIGIDIIRIASPTKYQDLKRIFGGKHAYGSGGDDADVVLQDEMGQFKMETIDVEQGNDDTNT